MKKLFHINTAKMNKESLSFYKKLKSDSGLSMVEMLATVILVGLMGIVITTGVSTIQNTYGKVVSTANEQTLLSTTLIEMRYRLRHSTAAVVMTSESCPMILSEDGYWFQLVNTNTDGTSGKGVAIQYYGLKTDSLNKKTSELTKTDFESITVNDKTQILLLPEEGGKISDVYAEFEKITFSDGVFTIYGLKVDNTTLLEEETAGYNVVQLGKRIGGEDDEETE